MNTINFNIATASDIGKSRLNNEDCMTHFNSSNGYVVAVCDGMGGENGGETASTIVVSIIEEIIKNNLFDSPSEAIIDSINAANKAVLRKAAMFPDLNNMGSTCVMAIINEGMVYYGSIGDSRIYYLDPEGELTQLTKDQSVVQALLDSGEITAIEAETHPKKNEILNAIGLEGMTPAAVCEVPLIPQPGSKLLLCTDGLTSMVPDTMIAQVLKNQEISLEEKVNKLVNLANEAGGLDNITIQVVEFDAPSANVSYQNANTNNRPAAPQSKGKKGWLFGLLMLILALGCAGFTYYITSDNDDADDVRTEKSEKKTKNVPPTKHYAPPAPSPKKVKRYYTPDYSDKSSKSTNKNIVYKKSDEKADKKPTPKKSESPLEKELNKGKNKKDIIKDRNIKKKGKPEDLLMKNPDV